MNLNRPSRPTVCGHAASRLYFHREDINRRKFRAWSRKDIFWVSPERMLDVTLQDLVNPKPGGVVRVIGVNPDINKFNAWLVQKAHENQLASMRQRLNRMPIFFDPAKPGSEYTAFIDPVDAERARFRPDKPVPIQFPCAICGQPGEAKNMGRVYLPNNEFGYPSKVCWTCARDDQKLAAAYAKLRGNTHECGFCGELFHSEYEYWDHSATCKERRK